MITALTELWNERDALLSALDRLPQTLCHRDIFPRNVFVQQTAQATQSIVIDWAFAGVGAVGEEVAALVGASLAFFEVEPVKGEELEQRCMSGYLAGLRSVGWDGDEADVRFGYLASYVLRYAIGTLTPVLTVLLDNSKHTWAEQVMRRPIGEIVANTRATVDFQEQRIAEARLILGSRQTCRSQSL